jgi:ribosomal protein S2
MMLYKAQGEKVSYEVMGDLLKNHVLFGIRTKNKNLESQYHQSRQRYNYLSADLYSTQMSELADYLGQYYTLGAQKNLFVVDRHNHYTKALSAFCRLTGFSLLPGKLKAGSMTNPTDKNFRPAGVFVLHDKKEKQSISECLITRTPVLGFNNLVKECSLYTRVVVMNNFNHNSINYSLWYLLKQLESRKHISDVPTYENYLEFLSTCE